MLKSLHIQNYAIIREIDLEFDSGLNIITGETGAGKSILLGALSLVAGNRADLTVLSDESKKCVVEAQYDLSSLNLQSFFEQLELDYEPICIIRREILPGGKTRAFVNDTPVSLQVLKTLSDELLDIHSQHQNLLLKTSRFQLEMLDAFAGSEEILKTLSHAVKEWKELCKKIDNTREENHRLSSEADFLQFQLDELNKATLKPGEEEEVERELTMLANSEDISVSLKQCMHWLTEGETNILSAFSQIKTSLSKVSSFLPELVELVNQVQALQVEAKELNYAITRIHDSIEHDPERLNWLEERMQTLQSLFKKHKVQTTAELIQIQNDIGQKLSAVHHMDEILAELIQQKELLQKQIEELCTKLTQNRKQAASIITQRVKELISRLGMPEASLEVVFEPLNEFCETGWDQVTFMFSANKGMPLLEIGKAGSGGEISRLMLAFKTLLSEKKNLSTILFDEIDTGVSGGMADKIGQMMKEMSRHRQLIVITHLPQIAGKSDRHFRVWKKEEGGKTVSGISCLDVDERLHEVARLLSGEEITEAALANARQLMTH
ncbi:MAG: DNA repair protein RecN [Flavobacteriales bacterium]|nr:DNA repair protein RecN [Flavobacteriales bacterium]